MAPEVTIASACIDLIAERGKTGRSMSPAEAMMLAAGIDHDEGAAVAVFDPVAAHRFRREWGWRRIKESGLRDVLVGHQEAGKVNRRGGRERKARCMGPALEAGEAKLRSCRRDEASEPVCDGMTSWEALLMPNDCAMRRLDGEHRRAGDDDAGKRGNEQFFVVPGHLKSPTGWNCCAGSSGAGLNPL